MQGQACVRVVAEEVAALRCPRIRHVEYAAALRRVSDLSDDLVHPAASCFEDIGRHLAAEIAAMPEVAALLPPGDGSHAPARRRTDWVRVNLVAAPPPRSV